MSKPLAVVVGITGKQGSSVVNALLKDGNWRIRGLGRDPTKNLAKTFSSRGVEFMKTDITQQYDLSKAFAGADAVFSYTNFGDKSQKGKENEIGILMADVAKECGVKFYVWSSLPNTEQISGGKYHVEHFINKWMVEEHLKKIGLPSAFIAPAAFMQNFADFGLLRREGNGAVLAWPMPIDARVSLIDIDDIGPAVVSMVNNQRKWQGKTVPFASGETTMREYLSQLEVGLGVPVRYQQLPPSILGKEGGEMFRFFTEFGSFGKNPDFSMAKELNPEMTTWSDFVSKGKLGELKNKGIMFGGFLWLLNTFWSPK
eukprot:TRINITY_DN10278_c0_g1_i1.p1 TRINITY_DN10278_c0_g1~~TRINITY_DN10278_c0_g1_i1.p1  ORF type:complete len:314 (-),score=58.46 TRINITY_DN10278_c0_g1_i1:1-942(-)